MSNFRVEEKEFVQIGQKPATSFKLYERMGNAFVHVGQFFAPRRDATDAQCVAHALREMDGVRDEEDEF